MTDPERAVQVVDKMIDDYTSGRAKYISYDLEVGGLGALQYSPGSYVIGAALASSADQGYFLVLQHRELSFPDVPQSEWPPGKVPPPNKEDWFLMQSQLQRLADNVEITGHHLKYDLKVTMQKLGIFNFKVKFDSLIGSYLRYHEIHEHGLKILLEYYTDIGNYDYKIDEIIGRYKRKDRDYGLIPLKIVGEYACYDSMGTYQLSELLEIEIDKYELREPLNLRIEGLQKFAKIEFTGVQIDTENLHVHLKTYQDKMDEVMNELLQYPEVQQTKDNFKGVLKLTSGDHVRYLLYEAMGLTTKHMTNPSKKFPEGRKSAAEPAIFDLIKELTAGNDEYRLGIVNKYRFWKKLSKIDICRVYQDASYDG